MKNHTKNLYVDVGETYRYHFKHFTEPMLKYDLKLDGNKTNAVLETAVLLKEAVVSLQICYG